MASAPEGPLLSGTPVACDPRPEAGHGLAGVTIADSISDASLLVPLSSTVVHICTPPSSRTSVLRELVEHGFRRFLVEKPLAVDRGQLDEILWLCRRHELDLAVVSHWLTARLTGELRTLMQGRELGALRSIRAVQHKPRFLRSSTTQGHPTAFDVEVPHSLGVAIDLAGPAELLDARCTDMRCTDVIRPRLGSAHLALRHGSGVRTEITSDLTSPVQQRSITLEFENGRVTGHYPLSENDDHAQLIVEGDRPRYEVFRDDALTAFMRRTYQDFHRGRRSDLALHCEVVRLLCEAKEHCGAAPRSPGEVEHAQ
nr:hypothetical protein [Saccharopolyspora phatthalungensis]